MDHPLRFRKRPVVVEAIQFNGGNVDSIAKFINYELDHGDMPCAQLVIETLEGDMTANVGDWVIKGVAGEAYPCKNEIFEATYEPAGDL